MRISSLESKSVAILGVGREGQAVWRQLRGRFPGKTVCLFAESMPDDGFIERLDPLLDVCSFGPFNVEQLQQFDLLVRSAGVSPYRPELQQLQSLGVQVTTANTLWFAEHSDANTICITGTKGKSTTAALTTHLLNFAGHNTCLAGNIGRPMLDCDSKGVDWWVIELSSYQLSDLEAEPDVAVILNLSDEHIDWHGGAERYRADKLRLAKLVRGGRLIANKSDKALVKQLTESADVSWFNARGCDCWQVHDDIVKFGESGPSVSAPPSLPGAHNLQNLAAALTIIDTLGLEISDLEGALATFAGLPHRLQLIGIKEGIRYVDDSISTTPVSVAAALKTLGNENVVLLLGGLDRGLDWCEFSDGLIAREPLAIITMPDNGPKILKSLRQSGVQPVAGLHAVTDLSQAVQLAQTLVPEKGTVLLSPGAPSFPQFRNFEDRGEQFASYAGVEKSTTGTH